LPCSNSTKLSLPSACTPCVMHVTAPLGTYQQLVRGALVRRGGRAMPCEAGPGTAVPKKGPQSSSFTPLPWCQALAAERRPTRYVGPFEVGDRLSLLCCEVSGPTSARVPYTTRRRPGVVIAYPRKDTTVYPTSTPPLPAKTHRFPQGLVRRRRFGGGPVHLSRLGVGPAPYELGTPRKRACALRRP